MIAPVPEHILQAEREVLRLLEQRTTTLALLDGALALRDLPAEALAETGLAVAFVGIKEAPGEIALRNFAGNRSTQLQDLVVRAGLGTGGVAFASNMPVSAADYFKDRSFPHAFDREVGAEGLVGVLAMPISFEGEVLGVLYGATRHAHLFSDRQLAVMERLGRSAGARLHLASRVASQTETAVQDERNRLSTQLHDTVGAMLFTINAQVRDLHGDPTVSPELAARLNQISGQLSEAGSALRDSLTALRPGPSTTTLQVALRSDCRAFNERTGANARSVVLSELPLLDEHRTATLTSVVREALVNVEKHSDARNVMVTAVANDGGVLVVVSDDGQSKGPLGADESSGTGLKTAQERLEQLGGRLTCFSDEDDGGWTLRAWVPIPGRSGR